MSADTLVYTSDANFKEDVVSAPLPTIVDFWAPWCGPCRMIAPAYEELSQEYAGKMRFAKLNTDENQMTAMQFGIMSIPTLLIFKSGQVVGRIVGAMPKNELKRRIDEVLAKA